MDGLITRRKDDQIEFFNSTKKTIEELTEVTNKNSLTPDLTFRLITPNCPSWKMKLAESPFPDPFWAFYWLGGQALARYILDHPSAVKRKTVLDLGSGCGALAIAAAKVGGAASVTANDIDPVSAVAIELNAELNLLKPSSVKISTDNLLEKVAAPYRYDVILLGDMFYDEKCNTALMEWLLRSMKKGVEIFIGDPGRHSFIFKNYSDNLQKIAEYPLSKEDKKTQQLDNDAIFVWSLRSKK